MGIKANKANGHKAEAEASDLTHRFPKFLRMHRTGLDGKHDLRGLEAIGEVKAVRAGPVWLKDALNQLDNTDDVSFHKLIMLKLSKRKSNRTGWIVLMDFDEFEKLLARLTAQETYT